MKKINLLWLFVLSVLIVSCTDNDSSSSEENAKNVEGTSLIGNKILNKLEYDKDFLTIKDQFYVWQNKENEIIFLSKNNTNRNLLILQGADRQTPLKDGNYEIVYLKHSFLAHNLTTGSMSYLKVPKTEESIITDKITKQNIDFDTQIEGFGLILAYID
ncbi:MAG: hypothetical protein JJE55_04935 [Flavobacteriaceae bacterium]|nr:hypothetical protein [Flavobacteriaceae bacterium]